MGPLPVVVTGKRYAVPTTGLFGVPEVITGGEFWSAGLMLITDTLLSKRLGTYAFLPSGVKAIAIGPLPTAI